jgi:hypothetical protein
MAPQVQVKRSLERIGRIREAFREIDHLCSGTLTERTKTCGNPGCRCRKDPAARHGPYYEWTHMKAGKLAHRNLSPQQAELLRAAIANYRKVKKLIRDWEVETEQLIDAQSPR